MINSGDVSWVLMSTALVMLMTIPGLAFFYGGLVRRKNVLATMMQSFFAICLISIQWVLWGYSLSFGPDKGHNLTARRKRVYVIGLTCYTYADWVKWPFFGVIASPEGAKQS